MKLFEELESKHLLTAYLPLDLNTAPNSGISESARLGDFTYFSARTLDDGNALWKTNGTSDGTSIVGKLIQQTGDWHITPWVRRLGDELLLFDTNELQTTIWSTNGDQLDEVATLDGRLGWSIVEYDGGFAFNIEPTSQDFVPRSSILWTDGTQVQTLETYSLGLEQLLVIDGRLVIDKEDGLWEVNRSGTPLRLIESRDERQNDIAWNDHLFSHDWQTGEVYVRDGLDSPPMKLVDLDEYTYVNQLTRYSDADFFYFATQKTDEGSQLWRSDGTIENTTEVATFLREVVSGVEQIEGQLYATTFPISEVGGAAKIYSLEDDSLTELQAYPDLRNIFFQSVDDEIYLAGGDATWSSRSFIEIDGNGVSRRIQFGRGEFVLDVFAERLIATLDGAEPNTHSLGTIDLSNERNVFKTLNVPTQSASLGYGIADVDRVHFSTNGLSQGRTFDGQQFVARDEPQDVQAAHRFGGRSVLVAENRDENRIVESVSIWIETPSGYEYDEVLVLEGKSAGVVDVEQVRQQLFVSFGNDIWVINERLETTRLSDRVPELAGQLVANPGDPFDLVPHDDAIYFIRNHIEIWRTDGTAAGTFPIIETSVTVSELVSADGELYFVRGIKDIVRVNATSPNVVDNTSLVSVAEGSGSPRLIGTDSQLFILEPDFETDFTQGSRNSIVRLKADNDVLATFDVGRNAVQWKVLNNELLLYYEDWDSTGNGGWTLDIWKTDGSAAGTSQIVSQPRSILQPHRIAAGNGLIYFSTANESGGGKLWATDGTDSNTYEYEFPGSAPTSLMPTEDGLVIMAGSERFGRELWVLQDPRPIPGDIDGNGRVGFEDFTKLNSQFGQRGEDLEADIDRDGDVDFTDFLEFTRNFAKEDAQPPSSALEVLEPKRVDLAMISL